MSPSPLLIRLTLLLGIAGFALIWLSPWQPLWLLLAGGLGLAAGIDAARVWQPATLQISRQMANVWPQGRWGEVMLQLSSQHPQPIQLCIHDAHPSHWASRDARQNITIPAHRQVQMRYQCCPHRRGLAHFAPSHIQRRSPWRLWLAKQELGEEQSVKVFPDYSRILGQHLYANDQRLPSPGLLRKRRRGEGTDFRQLREYRDGDSLRTIDWKASARQQRLISREYQEERDQQVVFVLDCGRRMLAHDGNSSHFDHALGAMLSLAWVAQRQGDAVGLLSFGSNSRWLPPHKGRNGLDRLLAGVYDLQADESAPDYLSAAQMLHERLKKRALVIFISNLRDEDEHSLQAAQQLLSRRHLVLCASLREAALDASLSSPVATFEQALRVCASAQYLEQRQQALLRSGLQKGQLLDVAPKALASALLDRYWEIKESGRL